MTNPGPDTVRRELLFLATRGWMLWGIVISAQLLTSLLGILYSWQIAFAPLILIGAAATFFNTRIGLYLLVISFFLEWILPESHRQITPADLVSAVLVVGYFARRMIAGERILPRTPVTVPFLLMLTSFALSTLLSENAVAGMRYWLRFLHLGLLFYAAAATMDRQLIRRLLGLGLVLGSIFAAFNIGEFVAQGGRERVFGIVGPHHAWMMTLFGILAGVAFIYATRLSARIGWLALLLLCLGGLFATQSRSAIAQAVFGVSLLVLILVFSRRGHLTRTLRLRAVVLTAVFTVVAAAVFSGSVTFLRPLAVRFEQTGARNDTLQLRFLLWKLGFVMFRGSPVLGVGLAQYEIRYQQLPLWRLDPNAIRTRNLYAHNDFIQYLAVSGIVGTIFVLFFCWRLISMGLVAWRGATSTTQQRFVLMSWIPICSIVFRIFWAEGLLRGTVGQINCLYFAALAVAWRTSTQPELPESVAPSAPGRMPSASEVRSEGTDPDNVSTN